MPSIPEYTARETTFAPSPVGASAWEQAGRRIGPLYNEAATFREQQGRLAAEAQKQKMWPFDILRLYQIQATAQAKAAANAPRTGFKVLDKPGATGSANDFDQPEALNSGWTPGYNDLGQVSRGAAALGNAVSDGGYGVAGPSRAKGGGVPPAADPAGGSDYTLYQGQFVSSAYGQKLDAEARANDAKELNKYGTNLSDYYSQYYGYQPVPEGNKDPSQGPAGNPVPNMTVPGYAPSTATGGYGGYEAQPGFFQSLGNWITGGSSDATGDQ
jgi:hypothetical protein